jgi:putative toxin-antitoxin system antitoxin component (TIGR02293 family)
MNATEKLRLNVVLNQAIRVFENEADARVWLEQTSFALGNVTPKSLLNTDGGMELVLSELGRMDFGLPV